ncbi:WhiB family transcriptional regulator [Crossiella sp. SN42]|uniref:WhiB family transcriptional regulator n=1 Tax=Crossiella sp. SN42 TaxID=2944808 RepID=UPI0035AB7871
MAPPSRRSPRRQPRPLSHRAVLGCWTEHAACGPWHRPRGLEPGDWQPDQLGARTELAIEVCAACPVRGQCLRHAMTTGEPVGIWGGLHPEQRRHVT